jgi:hypothetical protein
MLPKDFFKKLSENHPFITVCSVANQDYVGIMQNRDDNYTTIYDYGAITETKIKQKFLELGEQWWWESNRQVPINIFLREEWVIFKPYIKTFSNKNLVLVHGPVVSLGEFNKKRIRRKSITLVRKLS